MTHCGCWTPHGWPGEMQESDSTPVVGVCVDTRATTLSADVRLGKYEGEGWGWGVVLRRSDGWRSLG